MSHLGSPFIFYLHLSPAYTLISLWSILYPIARRIIWSCLKFLFELPGSFTFRTVIWGALGTHSSEWVLWGKIHWCEPQEGIYVLRRTFHGPDFITNKSLAATLPRGTPGVLCILRRTSDWILGFLHYVVLIYNLSQWSPGFIFQPVDWDIP